MYPWFLVFGLYAATQPALQLQQERIQVVRSNKIVRRIPTESNGTILITSLLSDLLDQSYFKSRL